MERIASLTLLAALALWACREPAAEPRVVLVGIDGGSWNLIDPLLAAGELPRLAELSERGVSAELETVEPVISPAVWTSIATGRRPEAHGVTSFFADRRTMRVATVWERLAASGVRVGLYDYLMTWPPQRLPAGFVVPGWLRRDDSVSPSDLFARAGTPGYAYRVVDTGTPDDIVAATRRELSEKPRTWNRLAKAFRPQVGVVAFYALDVVSHRFYPTALASTDPYSAPATARGSDGVVFDTLRGIDRALGEITADLEAADSVIVVSDHGFRATEKVVRHWGFDGSWLLAQAGIEAQRDGVSMINAFIHLSFALEPGATAEREAVLRRLETLVATLRAPASGASRPDDGEPVLRLVIVRPAEAEVSKHPEWMLDVVAHRRQAYALAFLLPIADTFDRLWPDGEVELGVERHPLSAFAAPHDFTGDHHPIGIFIAAGAAIRPRAERTRLSALDLAPLLFYLADRPIPDDLEGRLDESLIAPRWLARRPPRRVAAAEMPGLPEVEVPVSPASVDKAGDGDIERRLRALGYLE